MGGTIDVASTPGSGTVFEVDAAGAPPARPPPQRARAAAEPMRPPRRRGARRARGGQILYIEDNHVNVLLVEELVKSIGGLAIVSEPTGAAGVARAQDAAARPRPGRPAAARLRRLRGAAPAARRPGDRGHRLHRAVGQRHAAKTSSAASRPASPTTGPSRSTSRAFLAALHRRFPAAAERAAGVGRPPRPASSDALSQAVVLDQAALLEHRLRRRARGHGRRGTPRSARSSCPTNR